MSNTKKLIAVVGATGQQGGAVVRALQASGQFKVRALTRNPAKHPKLADEVVAADLNRPETLQAAFAGAHGVFLVTNAWEAGQDESKQALAAVNAAKDAGVQHFIWSTLPNVETISGGTDRCPAFHGQGEGRTHRERSRICLPHVCDRAVLLPKPARRDGSRRNRRMAPSGWALPLDPERRVIHMGDITELGRIVVGAFAQPELAGHGEHLPLVGDFLSFNEIVATLNRQGNKFSFKQVPREIFAGWFPGADSIAAMLAYFEAHTYLGSDSRDAIALANKVAGQQPTEVCRMGPDELRDPRSHLNTHFSE